MALEVIGMQFDEARDQIVATEILAGRRAAGRNVRDPAVADQDGALDDLVGQDEAQSDALRAIEFARIKGGKPLNVSEPWFGETLRAIGQPLTTAVVANGH